MQVGDRVTYFRRRSGSKMYRSATRIIGTVVKVTKTMLLIEIDGTSERIRAYADNCEKMKIDKQAPADVAPNT